MYIVGVDGRCVEWLILTRNAVNGHAARAVLLEEADKVIRIHGECGRIRVERSTEQRPIGFVELGAVQGVVLTRRRGLICCACAISGRMYVLSQSIENFASEKSVWPVG